MRCSRISELLSRYVSRELSPGETALVDSHLAACARCMSELSRMSRAVAALEMPIQHVEAPDMLAEIKRRAATPDRVLLRSFSVRAVAATAVLAILIVLSVAVLPHLAHRQSKAGMTCRPRLIALPRIPAEKQPESAKVVLAPKQTRPTIRKRLPTLHNAVTEVARSSETESGAQVTIMDPSQFEASREESGTQANVIISGAPDSVSVVGPVPPLLIADRPYWLEYRELPLRYSPQPRYEEDRYVLP